MKKCFAIALVAILVNSPKTGAVEWDSKTGLELKVGLFAPKSEGRGYSGLNGNEPFMMGANYGLSLRHGFSNRLVLSFTLNSINTYDDTTETGDQSYEFRNSDNAYVKLNGILAGVALQYYPIAFGRLQPYLLLGTGIDFWRMTVRNYAPEYGEARKGAKYRFSDLSIRYGLGLNAWLGEDVSLDLQARFSREVENLNVTGRPLFYGRASRIDERPFTAYFEPSLGLTFYFAGRSDRDNDGVKNKIDACPDTPGVKTDDPKTNGCPLDADEDGVPDGIDVCPETPAGAIVDITGCPLDTDKDGIPDGIDRCANTPPGITVDIRGCPLDSDKDGIPDSFDKCPDTPAGTQVDEYGCGRE
jgi:hypothetical protein